MLSPLSETKVMKDSETIFVLGEPHFNGADAPDQAGGCFAEEGGDVSLTASSHEGH